DPRVIGTALRAGRGAGPAPTLAGELRGELIEALHHILRLLLQVGDEIGHVGRWPGGRRTGRRRRGVAARAIPEGDDLVARRGVVRPAPVLPLRLEITAEALEVGGVLGRLDVL